MCEPVSLAVAATAVAASGQIIGGINQNKQARFQAKVAQQNAALDRRAAQDALARGEIEEQRQYRRTSQVIGQQRASMAANGIETGFGSAAVIQDDARRLGWEDANTIRENATREARGYEISAFNNEGKAASAKAGGKAALIGSFFDAGSTILSGAGNVGKMRAAQSGGVR